MTPLFLLFKDHLGFVSGAGLLGSITITIAFLGLWKMEETFGKELDFLEE
jgi:hypothetical protein